jgi:hypothetical protein
MGNITIAKSSQVEGMIQLRRINTSDPIVTQTRNRKYLPPEVSGFPRARMRLPIRMSNRTGDT